MYFGINYSRIIDILVLKLKTMYFLLLFYYDRNRIAFEYYVIGYNAESGMVPGIAPGPDLVTKIYL